MSGESSTKPVKAVLFKHVLLIVVGFLTRRGEADSNLLPTFRSAGNTSSSNDVGSPGRAVFDRDSYRVKEDARFAFVLLQRVNGSSGVLTVQIEVDKESTNALADEDFRFGSAEVTWKDGDSTPKAAVMWILDDFIYEAPDETITLMITDVDRPNLPAVELQSATVTIEDDCDAGTLSFESNMYKFGEGEEVSSSVVRVQRTKGSSSAVGVSIVLTPMGDTEPDELDLVTFTKSLSWDDGDGEAKSITVNWSEKREELHFMLSMADTIGGVCMGELDSTDVTFIEEDNLTEEIVEVVVPASVAVIVMSAFVYYYYRNDRKKRIKIQDVELQKVNLEGIIRKKEGIIRKKTNENAQLRDTLREAQQMIDKIVKEGGTYLSRFSIPYSSLEFEIKIGEGSFGTVFKGTHFGSGNGASSEPQEVAIKTVRVTTITNRIMQSFMDEIKIMAPLQHENIVGLIGGCWEDGPDKLAIVLEYCSRGSLASMLMSAEDQYTWQTPFYGIVLGIAECFRYLHHERKGRAIIHRDLKTDNVLVTSDFVAKIADFGSAREYADLHERSDRDGNLGNKLGSDSHKSVKQTHDVLDQAGHTEDGAATMARFPDRHALYTLLTPRESARPSQTMVGTPMYIAPEVLANKPYNKSADVYSFGITVLQVVVGTTDPRYVPMQYRGIPRHAVCEGWRPDPPEHIKKDMPAVWRLVRRCWKPQFKRRPDFNAICDYLKAIGKDAQSRHDMQNDTEDEGAIKAYWDADARRLKDGIKLLEEHDDIIGSDAVIEGLRARLALAETSTTGPY